MRVERRENGSVRSWRGAVRSKEPGKIKEVELDEDLVVETGHVERRDVVDVGEKVL